MDRTVFGLKAADNKGKEIPLAEYAGNVLIVVNTASKCGFTPQYKGLEKLYKKYREDGLVILGFPCDQFAHQEPGNDAEIASFCEINYGVTFPLMSKIQVNGKDTHPVFPSFSSLATERRSNASRPIPPLKKWKPTSEKRWDSSAYRSSTSALDLA